MCDILHNQYLQTKYFLYLHLHHLYFSRRVRAHDDGGVRREGRRRRQAPIALARRGEPRETKDRRSDKGSKEGSHRAKPIPARTGPLIEPLQVVEPTDQPPTV